MSVKAGTIGTPLREKKGAEKAQREKKGKMQVGRNEGNKHTGSSWKMKNNRKIKEETLYKACCKQLELVTGQMKRHGDWLHHLISGKTASAPKLRSLMDDIFSPPQNHYCFSVSTREAP